VPLAIVAFHWKENMRSECIISGEYMTLAVRITTAGRFADMQIY